MITLWVLLFIGLALLLAFQRASIAVYATAYAVYLVLYSVFAHPSLIGCLIWALVFLPLSIRPLRRQLLSRYLLALYRRIMPRMSTVEKEALTAGDVGFEAELFSGMPNWFALQQKPSITLSSEEQRFLAEQVETLCAMINDWEINHEHHQLSENLWEYIKENGFFGLIIPKKYGGKGFSALAHSHIITKIASVSSSVATVVCVPNSLGPAELLLAYGTPQQQEYYLPRLAIGEEIPCFALTSPQAGSDAGSIEDHGVVVTRQIKGVDTIGILLNWNKRYITLAPVATLLGLAFKLYDPDHLLSDEEARGITCALIPVNTAGVVTGRRHYPLCASFPNGPTQGKDVFIPLDAIIGGEQMIGHGWKMLMECLAAGRSISLPSMVTGGAKRMMYSTGAYARIRRQFNTHIGAFGGVQEALARILAKTYAVDALRLFSVSSVDHGIKSAVSSAIAKYHTTQNVRGITNDAMDIHGGKGICMGPNNYLAQSYIEGPISITVEGANILTRSMIIFGQGAIRCHPFVLAEMTAAQNDNPTEALIHFDTAFFSHLGMIVSNKVRAFILALSSGRAATAPKGDLTRYQQHFSRFAAVFSLISDTAMIFLGSELKRRESLSARLGDMLSLLYMGTATVNYYQSQANVEALPVAKWVCQDILFQLQNTIHEFLLNFPFRGIAWGLRRIIFPLGRRFNAPNDKLGKQLAELLLRPSMTREKLSDLLYKNSGTMQTIQQGFIKAIQVERLLQRLSKAQKTHAVTGMTFVEKVDAACQKAILTSEEANELLKANELWLAIINVDDFTEIGKFS